MEKIFDFFRFHFFGRKRWVGGVCVIVIVVWCGILEYMEEREREKGQERKGVLGKGGDKGGVLLDTYVLGRWNEEEIRGERGGLVRGTDTISRDRLVLICLTVGGCREREVGLRWGGKREWARGAWCGGGQYGVCVLHSWGGYEGSVCDEECGCF